MTRYTALPLSPDSELNEKAEQTRGFVDERLSTWDKVLLRMTCFCAVMSTLLALAVFLSRSPPAITISSRLKRPNPYPGLQNVLSNEPFASITSLSQLLLQVRLDDSSRRLYENTTRQHDSDRGMLYPDDRRLLASHTTSTLVQFKNVDYGMETCKVHVVLPNKTDELDPAINLIPSSVLDIWWLDSDVEISPHNPATWSHAPRRRSHFAQFEFPSEGTWTSEEFNCPSFSFTILEVACAPVTSNCHVEFWQDRMSRNGIYMEQFDSISRPKSEDPLV